MYSQFRVQNFRGFKDLELKDLARVNLIAGKNNVGKTALLEALFIYSGGYIAELPFRVQTLRGLAVDTSMLDTLFHEMNDKLTIEFYGKTNDGDKRALRLKSLEQFTDIVELIRESSKSNSSLTTSDVLQVLELEYEEKDGSKGKYHLIQSNQAIQGETPPPPAVHGALLLPNARSQIENTVLFGNLLREKNEDRLVAAMQIIDSRIESIISVPTAQGNNQLFVDIGLPKRVPLGVMGQGLSHLVSILLRMLDKQTSIIFIDEIENGIHYSLLEDIWRLLSNIAEENNQQIFATTHSLEMITAAQKAFQDMGEDAFRYYRLDRKEDGSINAVKYSPKTMNAAIEMNYEVRG